MKVLGVVGSRRKMGNTEILVKETLLGAREEGAEIALVRLTDLSLEECNGCMACVIRDARCGLKDDFYFLIDQMEAAEGMVLGAPTYIYGPAGVVKVLLDRFLTFKPDQWQDKRAVTIATAGRKEWMPYALPQLNCLAMIAGYGVVGSYAGESPGPGEILTRPDAMADVHELGRRLARSLKVHETITHAPGTYSQCPVCYSTHFEIESATEVICAMCRSKGSIVVQDGKALIRFDREGLIDHRFTPKNKAEHLIGWIKSTGPAFQGKLKEIQEKRQPYKDFEVPWLTPPNPGVSP
ncbi:MAG: flavodoxin family protein [Dehalococcoidia bacterium]|nr:flavodoxin family protein [Dehalococcoidia bacterium]